MVSMPKSSCIFNFRDKKIYIKAIRVLAGLLVLILPIFGMVKLIWYPKDFMYRFYAYDKGEFDIEFFGSSRCFCSVNPAILYEEQGITSYNLCGTAQFIPQTYYYLKEGLKRNKPRVAAIEVHSTFADSTNDDFLNTSNTNLQSMIPSVNKFEAIKNCRPELPVDRFFNVAMSHGNYINLTADEYLLTNQYDKTLGYIGYDIVYEHEYNHVNPDLYAGIETPIPEETEEYLRKCLQLCVDNNVEPILFCAPFPYASENRMQQYNYVASIGSEYGARFFNGAELMDEMGIDFSKDFEDEAGHLNYYGAEKFSRFFGEWLNNNVQSELVDHRNDVIVSGIVDWNEVVGNWHATKLRCALDHANSEEEYVALLEEYNADYVEITDGNYKRKLEQILEDLSVSEVKNVLPQMSKKIEEKRALIEGSSRCYFVYNRYNIEEVSIEAFPLEL